MECRYLFRIVISFPSDKYSGVGFLGHMVVLFLIFLRSLHTIFCGGSTNLRSHQKCSRVPFSPHFLSCLFFFPNACARGTCKFQGQGLNPSHSCDLHCSCGNAASFEPTAAGQGLNLHFCNHPSCCSWLFNPLHHSRNSSLVFLRVAVLTGVR